MRFSYDGAFHSGAGRCLWAASCLNWDPDSGSYAQRLCVIRARAAVRGSGLLGPVTLVMRSQGPAWSVDPPGEL